MSGPVLARILHVDDEPDIRAVVSLSLGMVGGFTVHSCATGADALAVAPEFRPDLVLLDVTMPGLSGEQTFAGLRELPATAGVPVVFMTAKGGAGDADALRGLGALDIIAKPFDPMAVPDQLRQIWGRHAGA
jgi:two-component system, OmpR family, response regulator